jgi:hypothetical protein
MSPDPTVRKNRAMTPGKSNATRPDSKEIPLNGTSEFDRVSVSRRVRRRIRPHSRLDPRREWTSVWRLKTARAPFDVTIGVPFARTADRPHGFQNCHHEEDSVDRPTTRSFIPTSMSSQNMAYVLPYVQQHPPGSPLI